MIPDKDKLFYIIAILLLFVVVDTCYNWYKDKENKDASRLLLNILAILGTIAAGMWLFDNTLSTRNAFKNSSLGAVGAAAFLLPALIRLSTYSLKLNELFQVYFKVFLVFRKYLSTYLERNTTPNNKSKEISLFMWTSGNETSSIPVNEKNIHYQRPRLIPRRLPGPFIRKNKNYVLRRLLYTTRKRF